MSVGSNDKQRGGVTGKGFEPEKSGNPSGISKEKAQLRRLFEEFIVKDGRMLTYLEELNRIATEANSLRMRIEAIKILLDKALGKDFHLDLGKDGEDIKIEFIQEHTIKNPDGTEINVTKEDIRRIIDAEEAGKFK